MHENLENSPALDPIPEEIRKAAEDFIDQNPQVLHALENAKSAIEVYEKRVELIAGSGHFFEVRGLDKRTGSEALESALIGRWSTLHPLDQEKTD